MKKDKSSVELISNSFYLMMDWVTITILSMIFWLVVGKTLPASGYGIVATTVNISLLIAAFALAGLPSAATNLISKYTKLRQFGKARGLIKFCLKFSIVVNIILAGIIILFSNEISAITNLPIESTWIISVMLFGWTFWLLSNGFLQGYQNMKMIFKSNLVGHIFKVTIPIVLFFMAFSFMGPLIAFVASLGITILIRYSVFNFSNAKKINGKKMMVTLAFPVFVASIMWLVFTNLPNVILNSLTSPDVTGIFALSLTLVTPIVFIPMTLSQALFPVTSRLSVAKHPEKRQSQLISLVIRYAAFVTLPLIALLFVFSNEIILFFSQAEYLSASGLLVIVAPAALMLGMSQILVSSIFAVGKPTVTRNITVIATLLFIGLSIPLTMMLSSTGMALAYLFSMIVLITSSFLYLRRHIGLRAGKKDLLKILIGTFVFVAITFPMNAIIASIGLKVALALFAGIVYLAVLIPLRYYSKDDIEILRYLTSKSKRLKKSFEPLDNILTKLIK